jgi:hypothetical protein
MPSTSGETNITGSNGTWTFHLDKKDNNKPDHVTITYKPRAGSTCKDVRLVQITHREVFDRNGRPFNGMPDDLIFKKGKNPTPTAKACRSAMMPARSGRSTSTRARVIPT